MLFQLSFLLFLIIMALRFKNARKPRLSKVKDAGGIKIKRPPLDIVFLHPDLGIGGAERLIVDAAVGLQHQLRRTDPPSTIRIFTNHHNPKNAFSETIDGTLNVHPIGSWSPRAILGRGHVFFATVRMVFLAWFLACWGPPCDVYIVDQVAAAMPLLRLLTTRPVFFYCHFPDQLCDPSRIAAMANNDGQQQRGNIFRKLYRWVFDYIEGLCMMFASKIVCNSKFTRQVTRDTFPSIRYMLKDDEDEKEEGEEGQDQEEEKEQNTAAKNDFPGDEHTKNDNDSTAAPKKKNKKLSSNVFYPPIDIPKLLQEPSREERENLSPKDQEVVQLLKEKLDDKKMCAVPMVSLNRYERKKKVELAIESFAEMFRVLSNEEEQGGGWKRPPPSTHLFVAGGYDPRLTENVEYLQELQQLAKKEGILEHVTFLTSISNVAKYMLLSQCSVVMYTPQREHFGIVPLEGMIHQKIVLACQSGGPLESITTSDQFGFLREAKVSDFAQVLIRVVKDEVDGNGNLRKEIGQAAKQRCEELFSLKAFSSRLEMELRRL